MNNGLLVDPHDQKAIADALLKLVADKNLWHECRKNGWKNIHLFSWPEHCRTYLTRVAACRMRHPQWKMDTPNDDLATESSLGDSLKDFQELSLRLSVDGEKYSLNAASDFNQSSGRGEPEIQDQVNRILNQINRKDAQAQAQPESCLNISNKYPLIRRRQKLYVIALDCYNDQGAPDKKMLHVIQETFKAVKSDHQMSRASGFALSTAMSISETVELLKSGKIAANEFDALICSSGSELYYPGINQCNEDDFRFCADPDYATHIEYRWGLEGVKMTVSKLMNTPDADGDEKSNNSSFAVVEDAKSCNAHCVSFLIKDLKKVCAEKYNYNTYVS